MSLPRSRLWYRRAIRQLSPLGGSRRNGHCPVAGPVAACCAPLLAGAVALVLVDKARVTFLVLFSSSIVVMVALMAESGLGWSLWPSGTGQRDGGC
jgi:hypothetical protein